MAAASRETHARSHAPHQRAALDALCRAVDRAPTASVRLVTDALASLLLLDADLGALDVSCARRTLTAALLSLVRDGDILFVRTDSDFARRFAEQFAALQAMFRDFADAATDLTAVTSAGNDEKRMSHAVALNRSTSKASGLLHRPLPVRRRRRARDR